MNKFASTLTLCYSIVKFLSCFFLSLSTFLYPSFSNSLRLSFSLSLEPRLVVGSLFLGSVRRIETDALCLKFSSNHKTTRCVELTFAPPFWIDSFFSGYILPVAFVVVIVVFWFILALLCLSADSLSLSRTLCVYLSLWCLLRRSLRICMNFLLACVVVRYGEKASEQREKESDCIVLLYTTCTYWSLLFLIPLWAYFMKTVWIEQNTTRRRRQQQRVKNKFEA